MTSNPLPWISSRLEGCTLTGALSVTTEVTDGVTIIHGPAGCSQHNASLLLATLLDRGYSPVIAPIAIDREGTSLNINADTAAGEIAVALRAFKLVNLTDVDGVMDAERTRIFRRLTTQELEKLIEDGTVSGGMIPKISSTLHAVKHGVEQAHIINGNLGHNLLLELFTDAGVGTMISR